MVQNTLRQVSLKVSTLITWLRGFEETGEIPIDSVAFETRNNLKDVGII